MKFKMIINTLIIIVNFNEKALVDPLSVVVVFSSSNVVATSIELKYPKITLYIINIFFISLPNFSWIFLYC